MDSDSKRDILIVGAGAAGLTAALHLSGQNLKVTVIDGAVHPGAENWSGCVYFGENLADEEVLGPDWLENTAIERKLVSRGIYMTNGIDAAGVSYKNESTFRNCATVLRPVFDHDLSEIARSRGIEILSRTTALGLIREDGRVIGVSTEKGPLYSDLVFLAEGDAAHLVSKEGYNNLPADSKGHYLQGIKEVIHLSESVINERFEVQKGEGAAYEMLIRNARISGKTVQLNMGAFIYTNRESLSIGLALPLDNLAKHFKGDHNKLMEWFKSLPIMKKWLKGGERTAYGAKIINANGFNNLSAFCDNGLAIGGACTGMGLDFPYPNYTGPAGFTGLCLGKAVKTIKETGGEFTRENLEKHYEAQIKDSSYFKDMKKTANWANYISSTQIFFSQFIDMKLDCQHPFFTGKGFFSSFRESCRAFFFHNSQGKMFKQIKDLLKQKDSVGATVGPFRMLFSLFTPSPLKMAPKSQGDLRIQIYHGEDEVSERMNPILNWFYKLTQPAIKTSFDIIYRNNGELLEDRFKTLNHVISKRAFAPAFCAFLLSPLFLILTIICFLLDTVTGKKAILKSTLAQRIQSGRDIQELTKFEPAENVESKLSAIVYETEKPCHIKVHWPTDDFLPESNPDAALWHICPAGVYHAEKDPAGMLRPVVDYENCVKCESCWRGSPLADWGRRDSHRLIYRVKTSAISTLIRHQQEKGPDISNSEKSIYNRPLPKKPEAADSLKTIDSSLKNILELVHSQRRTFSAGERRWIFSLFEAAANESLKLQEMYSEERYAILHTELQNSLDRIQVSLQYERFFWAAAEILTIRQHTLCQLGYLEETTIHNFSEKITDFSYLAEHFNIARLHHIKEEGLSSKDKEILVELLNLSSEENEKTVIGALASIDLSLTAIYLHNRLAEKLFNSESTLMICDDLVENDNGSISGTIPFALSVLERDWIVIGPSGAWKVKKDDPGLQVESVGAIGLRSGKPVVSTFEISNGEKLAFAGLGELIVKGTPLFYEAVQSAGAYLISKCVEHSTGRIQFPGLFQDQHGRDGIIKFGAVKSMISHMICRYEALKAASGSDIPEAMKYMQAGKWLGTQEGSFTYNATQVYGGTGFSEDDVLSPYYRDASIFKYLLGDPYKVQQTGSYIQGSIELSGLLSESKVWIEKARTADEEIKPELKKLRFRAETDFLFMKAASASINQLINSGASVYYYSEILQLLSRIYWNSAVSRKLDSQLFDHRTESGKRLLTEEWDHFDTGREFNYQEFLENVPASPTGKFLLTPNFDQQRYSPENLQGDKQLKEIRDALNEHFKEYFIKKSFEGMSYVRYAEKMHGHSDEVLEMFHDKGYMRLIIPEKLGGQGSFKAEYYLLINASMRFGDPALSLIIQASTSIGTSPMLIAWKKDIPKALKDIERLKASSNLFMRWQGCCQEVVKTLDNPSPALINKTFKTLGEEVRKLSAGNPFFKNSCGGFLRKLHKAGEAGKNFNFQSMSQNLLSAAEEIGAFPKELDQIDAEFQRRREGVAFFLSIIASGQTSAFALTEPSAGSDTARVATRAELRKVELTDNNGAWTFEIEGEKKVLIDISQTRLQENILEIKLDDSSNWSPVKYDKYNWEDDSGYRYFVHKDKEFIFHEFGTVLKEDDKYFYQYFELTGSKMWITNGRFAGLFAMYAKTPAGVTGFCADRYIEGLTIGKDEAKMGQNASPTNEVFLEKARICTSFILGLEGRGQVNALETLNVGRAGLSLSSLSLSKDMLQAAIDSDKAAQNSALLGQIAEEVIGGMSSTYEMIGLFDKPGSDARMESAIGKYMNSEILHRIILYCEGIYGGSSQNYLYDVEKKKRDARILNIYEGTNEIQRFLILKDLVDQISKKDRANVKASSYCSNIKRWEQYRQIILDLLKIIQKDTGSKAWMDSQLQPVFFPLAEAVAWLKFTDGVVWRLKDLNEYKTGIIYKILEGSAAKGFSEIDRRLQVFDSLYSNLSKGVRPPEITIVDEHLEEVAKAAKDRKLKIHQPEAGGAVTAFIGIRPLNTPEAVISSGKLEEVTAALTEGSKMLVDTVSRLPQSTAVNFVVAAPECASSLISHLSSYADVLWIDTASEWPSADDCAILWQKYTTEDQTLLFDGSAPEWQAAAGFSSKGKSLFEISEFSLSKDHLEIFRLSKSQLISKSSALLIQPDFQPCGKSRIRKGKVVKKDVHIAGPSEISQPPAPQSTESADFNTSDGAAAFLSSKLNLETSGTDLKLKEEKITISQEVLIGAVRNGLVTRDTSAAVQALKSSEIEFTLVLPGTEGVTPGILNTADDLPEQVVLMDFPESWLLDKKLAAECLRPVLEDKKLFFSHSNSALAGILSSQTGKSIVSNVVKVESDSLRAERFENTTAVKLPFTEESVIFHSSPEASPTKKCETVKFCRIKPEIQDQAWLDSVKATLEDSLKTVGADSISDADFILDIGYGIGSQDNYDEYIQPLIDTLKVLGVKFSVGASRKLVETLKILPPETQIGQSGSSVKPSILIAIGVSGAPQHINYISRNTVILSFNIDPAAPIMTFNESNPFPKVYPVPGNLKKTIPQLTAALKKLCR